MVLEIQMTSMTDPDFLEEKFCPKNWENGPKKGFFEFTEKFGH